MAPVEHVVADAGAFLQNAALQDIGKNIYTIRDVVSEIRDKATRRRLAVLPYELRFKEPFPEYVRLVTEFSKKTGDYPSLSATDIQVLALTYQLEAEFVGVSHLKQEPEKVKVSSSSQHPETPLHISGFHLPSKPKRPQETVEHGEPARASEDLEFTSFVFWRNPLPDIDRDLQELLIDGGECVPSEEEKEEDGLEEGKDQDSDDDGGGWITPSNIKQIQQELERCSVPKDVRVGCVTTDFAMQDHVRHEPSVLFTLWKQDPEEGVCDRQRRRNPAHALLPQPQGAESEGPPVLTPRSQRGQVRHQPPPDRGPALPSTAALPQGQAENRRVCPRLRSWGVSFCRERHLQPVGYPAGPRQHPGSREETVKSQCFQKEVCEEKVKGGSQASWTAAVAAGESRVSPPAVPDRGSGPGFPVLPQDLPWCLGLGWWWDSAMPWPPCIQRES
uniref:RNA-binding protein NOB1 n=1 Tax=Sus scrofa TaxID=9823 RepID=A0A8D1DK50_PIG